MSEPALDRIGHSDDEFVASITPDVMTCLVDRTFFQELDDHLCPSATSVQREPCGGNYDISNLILRSLGFGEGDVADTFAVLDSQGGHCDCEILFNVAEDSRLGAEYWRAKAEGKDVSTGHATTEG